MVDKMVNPGRKLILFVLLISVVFLTTTSFAVVRPTTQMGIQVTQTVNPYGDVVVQASPVVCTFKTNVPFTYTNLDEWISQGLPQTHGSVVPTEAEYQTTNNINGQCRGVVAMPLTFYVLKNGKWIQVCSEKTSFAQHVAIPGSSTSMLLYSAQCTIPHDDLGSGNTLIKVCSSPFVVGSTVSLPPKCVVVQHYTNSVSQLPQIFAAHLSPTSPACLLTLLLLGVLLASMYYSGQNPMSLLDITIPQTPKPSFYTAPMRKMGSTSLLHSLTMGLVRGNITATLNHISHRVMQFLGSDYRMILGLNDENAIYLANAILYAYWRKNGQQKPSAELVGKLCDAIRNHGYYRVFEAFKNDDRVALATMDLGEFVDLSAGIKPTLHALAARFSLNAAGAAKGRTGGNLTAGGWRVGKVIDRTLGMVYTVTPIGQWIGGVRDTFIAMRYTSALAKAGAALVARGAINLADSTTHNRLRIRERISETRFGSWVEDYSNPIMGKFMSVNEFVSRQLKDAQITFYQELVGSTALHILFSSLSDDEVLELHEVISKFHDFSTLTEDGGERLKKLRNLLKDFESNEEAKQKLQRFFTALDEYLERNPSATLEDALKNFINSLRASEYEQYGLNSLYMSRLTQCINEFERALDPSSNDLERLNRITEVLSTLRERTSNALNSGEPAQLRQMPLIFLGADDFLNGKDDSVNYGTYAFIMEEYVRQFMDYRRAQQLGTAGKLPPDVADVHLGDVASSKPLQLALLKLAVYTYGPPRDDQFFSEVDVKTQYGGMNSRLGYFRRLLGKNNITMKQVHERWGHIRDTMFFFINNMRNESAVPDEINTMDQFFAHLYGHLEGAQSEPNVVGKLLPTETASINNHNWKLNMRWLWLNNEEPVIRKKEGLFHMGAEVSGGRGLAAYSAIYTIYKTNQQFHDPTRENLMRSINGYYNRVLMKALHGGMSYTESKKPFTDYAIAYFRPRMYEGFREEVERYNKVYLAYLRYYLDREELKTSGDQNSAINNALTELVNNKGVLHENLGILSHYEEIAKLVAATNERGLRYLDVLGGKTPFVAFNDTTYVPYIETLTFSRYDTLLNGVFKVRTKDNRWETVDILHLIKEGGTAVADQYRQQLNNIALKVNNKGGVLDPEARNNAINIIQEAAKQNSRAAAILLYEFCQSVQDYTLVDHFEVGENAFIQLISTREARDLIQNPVMKAFSATKDNLFQIAERWMLVGGYQTANALAAEVPLNEIGRQSVIALSEILGDREKVEYYRDQGYDPFLNELATSQQDLNERRQLHWNVIVQPRIDELRRRGTLASNLQARLLSWRYRASLGWQYNAGLRAAALPIVGAKPLGTEEDLRRSMEDWFRMWLSYISRDPRGGNMMSWGMQFAWDAYYHGGGHVPPPLYEQVPRWPSDRWPRWISKIFTFGTDMMVMPAYLVGKSIAMFTREFKGQFYFHPGFYHFKTNNPYLYTDPMAAYSDRSPVSLFNFPGGSLLGNLYVLANKKLKDEVGIGGEPLARGMSKLVRTFVHYDMYNFGLAHHDEANPQHSLRSMHGTLMMDPRLATFMKYNDFTSEPLINRAGFNDSRYMGDIFSQFSNDSYLNYLGSISNVTRRGGRAIPMEMRLQRQLLGYGAANWVWSTLSLAFLPRYLLTMYNLRAQAGEAPDALITDRAPSPDDGSGAAGGAGGTGSAPSTPTSSTPSAGAGPTTPSGSGLERMIDRIRNLHQRYHHLTSGGLYWGRNRPFEDN